MYLNSIQIAESFGVSERVVESWIRNQGLPCMRDRGRLLFDRAQVAHWAANHGLAAQAGFLAPDAQAAVSACRIGPLLRAGGIWRDVAAAAVPEVIDQVLATLPAASDAVRNLLVQRLRQPGGLTWAPVGGGYALPHSSGRIALGRDSGRVALILLRENLRLPEAAPDGQAVRRLLFFIPPSPRAHLELLGRLSGLLSRGGLRAVLDQDGNDARILHAVEEYDASIAPSVNPEGKRS